MNPPANTIHLWAGAPPADVSWLEPDLILSSDEQQRLGRLERSADRDLFAWSHAMVRRVLSRYAPIDPAAWVFHPGEHGRPEIANNLAYDLRFNLSHATGIVAIVVNRSFDVGVDVERIGRVTDVFSVARSSFSQAESALLTAAPVVERAALFVQIWTLKEAFLKAKGLGGYVSLADFSFDPNHQEGIRFTCQQETGIDPSQWSFALSTEADDHVLAIACAPESPQAPPEIIRFSLASEIC